MNHATTLAAGLTLSMLAGCASSPAPTRTLDFDFAFAPATTAPSTTEEATPPSTGTPISGAAVPAAAAPTLPILDPTDLEVESAELATQAGERYGPEIGQSIVSLAGGIRINKTEPDNAPSTTDTDLSAQLRYGYFIDEAIEVGAQAFGVFNIADTGPDTVFFFAEPYANYNHRVSDQLWLYVGPHFGLAFIDAGGLDDTSFSFGGHGGARNWLDATTSLFFEVRYTWTEFSLGGIDQTENDINLLVGFDHVF